MSGKVLLVSQAWSSNEHDDGVPYGYAIGLSQGLLRRVEDLSEVVRDHDLQSATINTMFVVLDAHDGLDALIRARFNEQSLSDMEYVVLDESDPDDRKIMDFIHGGDAAYTGDRGHAIQVLESSWTLRCYNKYSDTQFESATMNVNSEDLRVSDQASVMAPS